MKSWKRIAKIFSIIASIPFLIVVVFIIPLMTIVIAIACGGVSADESLDIWTNVKNEIKFEQAIENDISSFLLSYSFLLENGYSEEENREKIKEYVTDNMCVLNDGDNRFLTLQEILTRQKTQLHDDDTYQEFIDTLKIHYIFEPQQDGKYPYPLEDFYISSPYGKRQNPTGEGTVFHHGIDLVGAEPYSPIISISDGKVVKVNTSRNGLGNYVVIKYIDETGVFYGVYGHMSGILATVGDEVYEGEVIGLQGGNPDVDPNSGNSTGRHLHFELRLDADSSSTSFDPEEVFNG